MDEQERLRAEKEEDDALVQEVLDFLDCLSVCPLPTLPYEQAVTAEKLLESLHDRFGPWEHKDYRYYHRSQSFLEKGAIEKLKKAIVVMANGPDPRYIPHLYCTVLGSVMGPIGLRRLSMETGGVELLNTLFEIQSKMNTLYDLYLWRHWIWLFENEFEVEERIWSAETYARIVWLYERTPDETNILATLLQVAGNPNCHSVFTDPDETIELFLKMAYSLPNRNATLGAVALGCLSVSPVFTQRLLDHKDVTQLFDSVLRSIPLQSMTELSSFLCGDMESVWASLRPFTQLLKSPLTVAQLLGLCWLATFCHKQEERIMLAQYNGFSDIVLLSFSKNETLSQLAQTCLEHVKDLPKNAPSLQEMCVRVAVETNNLKVKDQVTLLPADILSAYPALVYQQDSA